MKVFVTTYEHRHGTDVQVFATRDLARKRKADLADEYWHEFMRREKPEVLTEEDVEAYWEEANGSFRGEWFDIHECELTGTAPDDFGLTAHSLECKADSHSEQTNHPRNPPDTAAPMAGVTTAVASNSQESNMIDFNLPIETIDGDAAIFVQKIEGVANYPYLVKVGDEAFLVDEEGDSETCSSFIVNTETASEEESENEAGGPAELPSHLQFRVIHTKRGAGVAVKVRGDKKRPLGIRLDSGSVNGDGGILWALAKNVTIVR